MKKRSRTLKTRKSLREEIIGLGDRSVSKSYYPQLQEQIRLLEEAKKKAEESKTILHLFIEYSPAAIAMFDRKMRYVAVSRRWLTDYGLGKKQIIGRSHYEVFPEIPERWKEIHRRCLAGAIEKAEEDPFVRTDGTIDWVRWEIHPWQTTTGEIGGIIIFSEVITEFKNAKDALRVSEERWKFALEGAGDGVWDWNAQTNEVFFSRRWKEMLGHEEHEIGNTLDEWDKRVHPDDKKMVYGEIEKHFRGETDVYVSEHRVLCKDGTYKWVLDRGKVIARTDEGKPLRVIGTHTDITERKQAEDILRTRLHISEFAATHSENEIIQATLDEAERLSRSSIGFFHYVDDDQKTLRLQMWSTNTIRKMCTAERKGRHYPISEAGVWVDCVRERGPVIHNDYESLPHKKGFPQGHAKVVRELVLPIIIGEKIHALIGVGNKETNYDEIDVKIVSDLAYMSWDIIKRKRAEEALQESEDKFKYVFESANVGKSITLPTGEINVNKAFADMLGYSREELRNKTWQELTPPDEIETIQKILGPLLIGEQDSVRFDKRYIHKNGSHIWADLSVAIRRDSGGKPLHFITTIVDITKRKRAEEKLQSITKRLETLINVAPLAILVRDKDGNIQLWNKAAEQIFGWAAKEVIGYPVPIIPEEKQDEHKAWVSQIMQGNPLINQEAVRQRNDGSLINVSISSSLIPGTHGDAITIIADITKRTRTEGELKKYREHLEDLVKERTAELEQANERLKELDRLKSMFIASMSHELRTPLNSVIGFSSVLMKEWVGTLNDEQKNMSSIILKAGKHLLSLINDVIDVSKIEAGMIDIHHDDFDVDDIITDTVESLAKDIEDKGLLLNVATIHQQMHTDRSRLLQCILNLLSNAMKFTEKGTITVSVKQGARNKGQGARGREKDLTLDPWRLTLNGDFVEISVTDTGIGIKEEDIPKLFQAFLRLESPLKTVVPGTGLGLYLTKKLVTEVLQGDITVESKYGEGSKFIMKIPISVKSK